MAPDRCDAVSEMAPLTGKRQDVIGAESKKRASTLYSGDVLMNTLGLWSLRDVRRRDQWHVLIKFTDGFRWRWT